MATAAQGEPEIKPDDLSELLAEERLPVGREALAEPPVAHSQHERILDAMAKSCEMRGFTATTVADVCALAGVSRATFYELFKDKEDCFYAAVEVALADTMGAMVAVYSPDKPWGDLVRDGADAMLALLAMRPDLARMALVEAPACSPRAHELYASVRRVIQALLDRGRRDPMEERSIPSSAGRAALAGAESLLVGQILAGNGRRLRELLPDVVYMLIVPYLGQEEALRQMRAAEKLLDAPPKGR